jgi:hypothetical protein
MDPEPGGPKTYGSYGSGSATLPKPMAYSLILLGIEEKSHGAAKQMGNSLTQRRYDMNGRSQVYREVITTVFIDL